MACAWVTRWPHCAWVRRWHLAAGWIPEMGELEVRCGGNPREALGVKQILDGDTGVGKERCCCLLGRERAQQEGGLGGCRSFSCLSLPLPALLQAAILQQTAEYIFSLEQEKTRLLQQNTQLKRFIQVTPACVPQGWDGRGWDRRGWDSPSWLGREHSCCSLGSGQDPLP